MTSPSTGAPGAPDTGKRIFIGLILASIALMAMIVLPFATALFLAAILAGVLYPLFERLAALLGGRRNVAAGLITVGFVLLLLLPVGGIVTLATKQAIDATKFVRDALQSEGVPGLIARLPDWMEGGARWLLERIPEAEESVTGGAQGARAAAAVTGVLSATSRFVLNLILMLIAFVFFFLDGAKLVHWLNEVVPLRPGHLLELLAEFRRTSVAVAVSTLSTAAVQAVAALAGYLLAHVPNPLFFGLLTFFFALIPAVGAAVVSILLALLLIVTQHVVAGVFLALWGMVVVGLVDNVIKPLLIRRGLAYHGAVIFFALLGGIAALGPVGLIAGPMILSFFLSTLRIYQRDFAPPKTLVAPVAASAGPPSVRPE